MKGKRGPRPERGPGKFAERATKAAKDAGLKVEKPKSMTMADQEAAIEEAHGKQALLPDVGENPIPPATVRGELMLANYVRPVFGQDEESRFVDLEFSFALTPDHKPLMPGSVNDSWRFLERHTADGTKVMNIDIEPQTVDIHLAADDKEVALHLSGVPVTRASLAIVEETGKGATTKKTRFSFRLRSELTKAVIAFATSQYGNQVWLAMSETQGRLGE